MTKVTPDIGEIMRDPTWFPHAFDWRQGLVSFARISRARLAAEPFLDERMEKSVTGTARAQLDTLVSAAAPAPAFIFHTAFCCSTLMASALDEESAVLSLKEPNVLMGASNALRMAEGAAGQEEARRAAASIIALLARRHAPAEQILIKPTNTANNLAPLIAASGAPVIFLYGDLRAFLVSVLKKGEACKAFIRKQYTIFALDGDGVAAIPQRQALGLTDLQIAALVWRHQMELFSRVLSSGGGNVRSLYFRALLKDPKGTLTAAATHLKLGLDESAVEKNVASVFSRNSKFGDQGYTPEQRSRDERALEDMHRGELDLIEEWARQLKLQTDVADRLPNPL